MPRCRAATQLALLSYPLSPVTARGSMSGRRSRSTGNCGASPFSPPLSGFKAGPPSSPGPATNRKVDVSTIVKGGMEAWPRNNWRESCYHSGKPLQYSRFRTHLRMSHWRARSAVTTFWAYALARGECGHARRGRGDLRADRGVGTGDVAGGLGPKPWTLKLRKSVTRQAPTTLEISVLPMTKRSILVRRKQSSASHGLHTTGSFSLKEVLSSIGMPVRPRK
jgi:hypothetical protein